MLRGRTVLSILSAIVLGTLLLGLMGTAAFRVLERRRELGVMRALGATRAAGVIAVLAESTVVTAIGLAAGGALLLVLRAPMARMIPFFAIHSWMVAAIATLFFVTGWLASVGPAARAARVPPSVASRGG